MDEANWYVVHTYSGYENKVKVNIDKTVENRNMGDQILEVMVPMENVVEMKNGVKKESSRKMFPGYVLVKMVMTDEAWYVVRNTRGVTGFVGPGSKPVPLTYQEIKSLGIVLPEGMEEPPKQRIQFAGKVGDRALIVIAGTHVPGNQVGEVFDVLLVQRQIQTQRCAQLLLHLLRSTVGQHPLYWITGQANQHKDQTPDEPYGYKAGQNTFNNKFCHVTLSFPTHKWQATKCPSSISCSSGITCAHCSVA